MPPRPAEALLVHAQHRLVLRWRPQLHAFRRGPSAFAEAALLRGVGALELGFWQADLGWVAGWDASDLLTLVRFRLAFNPPGHWPDTVGAPGLDRP